MSTQPSEPNDANPEETAEEGWGWTRVHRLGVGLLAAIFLGLLFYQWTTRPKRLDDSLVIVRGQAATLPQLMDPNTATAEELARIPGVGVKTAEAVVRYREARKEMAEGGRVFLRQSDLSRVPGVGKKAVEAVRGYLAFPEEEPVDASGTEPAVPE